MTFHCSVTYASDTLNMAIYKGLLVFALVCSLALTSDAAGERFEIEYHRKTYKLLNVTDTVGYCMNPPPVPSVASNRDNFINSDLRFALCKLSYQKTGREFDSSFGHVVSAL